MDRNKLLGHMRHISRFVPFSPVRNRCQIGTVGFDQHAIQRRMFGDVSQHRRILEGENPRKGQVKSQIQRILRQPGIS